MRLVWMTVGLLVSAAPLGHGQAAKVTVLQQVYQAKLLLPGIKTIGFLMNTAASKVLVTDLMRAGQAYQIEIVVMEVREVRDVSQRFNELTGQYKIDLLWLGSDPILSNSMSKRFLITSSITKKIPTFAPDRKGVEEGATFTVTNDEAGKVIAVINDKSAGILGLTTPPEMTVEKV